MANKTIYDLTENQALSGDDLFEQDVLQNDERKSLKTTLRAIADKIITSLTFSGLNTTDKTIEGAINEVAQGGGGGTGGHTIIDENGTSMTARAGLQFVGGANVSDDATNNKTIVDLASAGGIDGVFIDTDNVIQTRTTYATTFSYTATEDCVAIVDYANNPNNSAGISVDDKPYSSIYSSSLIQNTATVFLKKGQTLKGTNTFSGADVSYIVYGIQTGTTHSKFQPVIYSTEEREIGVWTDGKPLYQKTFLSNYTTVSGVGWQVTDINLSDYDIDLMVCGQALRVGGDSYVIYDVIGEYGISSGGYLQFVNVVSSPNERIYCITLLYTKATDTAGSGSWTPQGVPAVHYSTEERVIGTWIDGSTLYEKTWDVTDNPLTVPYNTWTNTPIKKSDYNIKSVISSDTVSFNGNTNYPFMSYNAEQEYIRANNCRNANLQVGYITLRYIKSS